MLFFAWLMCNLAFLAITQLIFSLCLYLQIRWQYLGIRLSTAESAWIFPDLFALWGAQWAGWPVLLAACLSSHPGLGPWAQPQGGEGGHGGSSGQLWEPGRHRNQPGRPERLRISDLTHLGCPRTKPGDLWHKFTHTLTSERKTSKALSSLSTNTQQERNFKLQQSDLQLEGSNEQRGQSQWGSLRKSSQGL